MYHWTVGITSFHGLAKWVAGQWDLELHCMQSHFMNTCNLAPHVHI